MAKSSWERQLAALQRRFAKEQEDHAAIVAAKNQELRALRNTWELLDSFPALIDFLAWLHKIRDAAGPLRSASYDARPAPGFGDPTGESAKTPNTDRTRLIQVNQLIEYWSGKLEKRLTPKGPLVDDEFHETNPAPRCYNPACPARLIAQGFDQEICHECKTAFTEFRPTASRRCWTRDCPYYSKTGQCVHAWQKFTNG